MKSIRTIALYAAILMAGVAALKLLGWLPGVFQREGLRRYATLEAAVSELRMGPVAMPAYFPQYLSWPPDEVYARRKPYRAILVQFSNRERKEIALAVSQTDPRDPAPLRSRIEPADVHAEETVTVKGRPARLVVAACKGGGSCNAVTWEEDGIVYRVTARDSVREVLRIADSMVAE